MKICFSARPAYDEVSIEMFKTFKNKKISIESIFVTSNGGQSNKLKQRLGEVEVYNTSDFIRENWDTYSVEELMKYEKKYDCEPIWNYIYTDRFLIHHDYDYSVRVTTGLFHFYESVFKDSNIDVYYDETIATLQSYIAYIVGKYYNVKYVAQMVARGLENKFHYIVTEPFQHVEGFDKNYLNKEYSMQITDQAEEFLYKFESERFSPPTMVFVKSKPSIELKWLGVAFLRFADKKYHNKFDYLNYNAHKKHFSRFNYYFKYLKARKHYKKADLNKKFVYFPLHYQPEASTIVCAQKYEKQLYFIDSWAKSLPADTLLYVKEHYALVGHRELSFYDELKKYPNVVLVDPWESSSDLLDNCVAVTTLTGTAGWEGMLMRKPVFMGGSIFYETAPGIIKVDDIYNNYIEKLCSWKKPKREDVIKYLSEYMSNIYEGSVYFANKQCLEKENIEKIVDSLINYLMEVNNE